MERSYQGILVLTFGGGTLPCCAIAHPLPAISAAPANSAKPNLFIVATPLTLPYYAKKLL